MRIKNSIEKCCFSGSMSIHNTHTYMQSQSHRFIVRMPHTKLLLMLEYINYMCSFNVVAWPWYSTLELPQLIFVELLVVHALYTPATIHEIWQFGFSSPSAKKNFSHDRARAVPPKVYNAFCEEFFVHLLSGIDESPFKPTISLFRFRNCDSVKRLFTSKSDTLEKNSFAFSVRSNSVRCASC